MKLFGANSYCNPDDPRDFIFASSTNDWLGVLPNLARGRAKRICRKFALPFAFVLLPCLALYLYNRAFYPLFMVVLLGGLWIRSRYFKRPAEEELAACPGPRGPRDGVGREASAERVVRQAMEWVSIFPLSCESSWDFLTSGLLRQIGKYAIIPSFSKKQRSLLVG